MLKFRALALSRMGMGSRVWPWDICAVYYAHCDDTGGNWRPPTGTATTPGYEKCRGGEVVEVFSAGLVTWMFTEDGTP